MTFELVAPTLLAVSGIPLLAWLRRRIPPRAAIVVLTLAAVSAAATVVWALALLVLGALVGMPEVLAQVGWCRGALMAGHRAPLIVGFGAATMLSVGAARLTVFEVRWRRSVDRHRYAEELTVLDVTDRIAYSVPSRKGTVVVSRGLLRALRPAEQSALLAHERCHLDRRHHRYLHAAGLAAAVVPPLAPLARHLRVATEREADEAAAEAVGSRRTVASAIAAAIGSPSPLAAAAAGEHAVTERIHALLYPSAVAWLTGALTAGVAAALLTLSSSTIQLHHLLLFATHVCGLS